MQCDFCGRKLGDFWRVRGRYILCGDCATEQLRSQKTLRDGQWLSMLGRQYELAQSASVRRSW